MGAACQFHLEGFRSLILQAAHDAPYKARRSSDQREAQLDGALKCRNGVQPVMTLDSILQYNHQLGSLLSFEGASSDTPMAIQVIVFLDGTHPICCRHSPDSNPDKAICSLQRPDHAD